MACINADGSVTIVARQVLAALERGATVEAVAVVAAVPIYRVRASLRELAEARLVEVAELGYRLTEAGRRALATGPKEVPEGAGQRPAPT